MRTKIIFGLLLLVMTGLGCYVALRLSQPSFKTPPIVHDYDNYDYGRGDAAKVIDVGTQPFGLLSTNLCEHLLRDRILQQHLAAEGWQLREHGYRSGKDMLAYADGRLDIMLLGDIPAFSAMQQRNVGIFALNRQGYNSVIVSRRLTPAEFKGLRVGYPAGTSAHFTLEQALESANLTMNDIAPVALQANEMESALRSRSVDAVAIWEPMITTILDTVPGSTIFFSSETYNYTTVDLDFATRHPSQLKAFLAASIRAAHWDRLEEENLRTALLWIRQANLRFSGASDVEANTKWTNLLRRETIDTPSFPMLPHNLRDEHGLQRQQFEFLKRNGILPTNADWSKVRERIDTALLPEIIRDGEKWRINSFDYAPDRLYQDKEASR